MNLRSIKTIDVNVAELSAIISALVAYRHLIDHKESILIVNQLIYAFATEIESDAPQFVSAVKRALNPVENLVD